MNQSSMGTSPKLYLWRMPAGAGPAGARGDNHRVVHVQRTDRGPTDGRQADQLDRGAIPCKVIQPSMLARMKQRRGFAGQRIRGSNLTPLVFVATATGKTEIAQTGDAALCRGYNMVDDHRLARIRLGRLAIGAAMVVYGLELFAEIGGEIHQRSSASTAVRLAAMGGRASAESRRPGLCAA